MQKEHFIILLPVLNSFKCLIIHYTIFVRKDFKPFCAKFRPVGLKSLNKIVRLITGIILVNLDLRCIENVLTDYDSQHLQNSESS